MNDFSLMKLDAEDFEILCSAVIKAIAMDRGYTPVGPSTRMAPTHDGGIEAKVGIDGGVLGIQCKAYSDFNSEITDVKKSFNTMLGTTFHKDVTVFVWCSRSNETASRGTKAGDALDEMERSARTSGRTAMKTVFLAVGDLEEIVREYRPEYAVWMAGHYQRLGLDDVESLSRKNATEIYGRVDERIPDIRFPVPETEEYLELLDRAVATRKVSMQEVQERGKEVIVRSPGVLEGRYRDVAESAGAFGQACSVVAADTDVDDAVAMRRLEDLHGRGYGILTHIRDSLEEDGANASEEWDPGTEGAKSLGRSVLATVLALRKALAVAFAARERTCMVMGPWGSGKSFAIAEYATKRLNRGAPTVLVRARDFSREGYGPLEQPWRHELPNSQESPEVFCAMLDALGRQARCPVSIVIDGVNEAPSKSGRELSLLRGLVAKNDYLQLIVTSRTDKRVGEEDSPVGAGGVAVRDGIPMWRHRSPSPARMRRVLEDAFSLPPGTQWLGSVSNPLLAAMAARVLGHRRTSDAALNPHMSRVELLDEWIGLVAREASVTLDVAPSTVRRIIDSLTAERGTATVDSLVERTGIATELVDRLVDHLTIEGLFEMVPDATPAAVRFHWEGAAEQLRIQSILEDEGTSGIGRVLAQADDDRRETLIEIVAQCLAAQSPSVEIPDARVRGVTREEAFVAFTWTLTARQSASMTPRTQELVSEALSRRDGSAELALWAVLNSPWDGPIGPKWLGRHLASEAACLLRSQWPHPLENLADASPATQEMLAEFLTWLTKTQVDTMDAAEASAWSGLLAWFACADRHTRLPALAVRVMTELLHRHPQVFGELRSLFRTTVDDHPRDALLCAAAGVVARWPGSGEADAIRSACEAHMGQSGDLHSFEALASLYLILAEREPFHAFLLNALPTEPARRSRRVVALVDEVDRNRFADGRDAREASQFESAILLDLLTERRRPFGPSRRRLLDEAREDEHIRNLVKGRWLAFQIGRHGVGASMFHGMKPVKVGSPGNSASSMVSDPRKAGWPLEDPTVPLAYSHEASHTEHLSAWWCPDSGTIDLDGASLTRIDASGTEWIIIEGLFRALDPAETTERPTIGVGRTSWMNREADQGLPAPGTIVNGGISVCDARLMPSLEPSPSPFQGYSRWVSDIITDKQWPGELVVSLHDSRQVVVPTGRLLSLVGASWTGNGLDCVDREGSLVIFDPSTHSPGPRAILVRKDALQRALDDASQTLAVSVRRWDNLARRIGASEQKADVTIRGAE